MADSDGDIEYLDEDADVVQQCVQAAPAPLLIPKMEKPPPLLIERQPVERKRKRKKDEEDSDYDPTDDFVPPSPPSPKSKKKKQNVVKKVKSYQKFNVQNIQNVRNIKLNSLKADKGQDTHNFTIKKKIKHISAKEIIMDRKKCTIMIPDYDDPLCLPVKAIKHEDTDIKRLNNWNNVCLEHFKHCDNLLRPERGETHSSTRTLVFRNVANKQSGKLETTIWSKTCVENDDGDKKSEIFQCVLPRYKEKRVLTTFGLGSRKPKPFHVTDEVILCKEEGKDGEVLVTYKPKEALSAVYKLVVPGDRKTTDGDDQEPEEKEEDEDVKMYMKELAYCKVCAPCYQMSWRGVNKGSKKRIDCPICGRSFITVYNLLAHFKSHSSEEVQKHKMVISSILAEIVDYHYKCRVCREQFVSIKALRQHLVIHQGDDVFTCEVGNHVAR